MDVYFGIKPNRKNVSNCDRVILYGTIWVGRFVAPLKDFVKRYKKQIHKLVFVTCCGSTYDKKDEKFGHGLVFNKVKNLLNGRCEQCIAFPIDLVLSEEQKVDDEAFLNTHLNDDNFKGEKKERFNKFIKSISD